MLLLFVFAFLASCVATTPVWHKGYAPGLYGQVDSVELVQTASPRVFASLFDKYTFGYDMKSGDEAFGRTVDEGVFLKAAAHGGSLFVLDAEVLHSGRTLQVSRYSTSYTGSSPSATWTVNYANASSQMIEAHASHVFVGVTQLVKPNQMQGFVDMLDGQTGHRVKRISCAGAAPSVALMLMSVDSTESFLAFACRNHGAPHMTVNIQKITDSKPMFQVPLTPASGVGFALSSGGAYLSVGVSELWVYQNTGSSFKLLFKHDPVPAGWARLVESIAFGEKNSLAVGYLELDLTTKMQRSLLEVYSDLPGKASPTWSYYLANSTSPLQDSVADLSFCGDYLSMASWGTESPATPTSHLFHIKSSSPVLQFNTPGSMMSTSCFTDPQFGSTYVAYGGKRIHANQMGSGGDLYLFKV